MSTKDQEHTARLQGEALVAARDLVGGPDFDDIFTRLARAADNPAERGEIAARLAREALAQLGPDMDREGVARRFLAAGLLLESGPVDGDRLGQVVRADPPT